MTPKARATTDRALDGFGRFVRGSTPPMKLRIQGIREPGGARCIKLDVSRGNPADIFAVAAQVPEGATLAIVDTQGTEYSPIGYMYTGADQLTSILLEPAKLLQTIDELPQLPTSGNQRLLLLFYVTEGATIAKFRFGDLAIAKDVSKRVAGVTVTLKEVRRNFQLYGAEGLIDQLPGPIVNRDAARAVPASITTATATRAKRGDRVVCVCVFMTISNARWLNCVRRKGYHIHRRNASRVGGKFSYGRVAVLQGRECE